MEYEMTERQMANGSAPVATTSSSSRPTNHCNAFANSRSHVFLHKEEYIKEWQALLDEARNITAASSIPMIVWKVCKVFFDETNPVVLAYILMNIQGEGSWIKCIPLLVNLMWSAIIAFYICNEKREICRAKQGQQCSTLFGDTIRKMLALMFDWITEYARGKKRCHKIRIIEDNMYRCSLSGRWVTKEAFIVLTKFYSSQLRYLREDILVTTLRSFTLAMVAMFTLADPENFAFRICEVGHVFKLGYVIWIILKTSYIMKSFQDVKQGYVATVQLWGTIWTEKNSTCKIQICEYHKVQDFEKDLWLGSMKILDIVINFVLMANRFITASLCLIIVDQLGLGILLWFLFICAANVFMLDFLQSYGMDFRIKYDNPPTGYSRKRQVWVDRFMTAIFYNYGYSSQGLCGVFGWKTFFTIPPTIIFTGILFFYKGTLPLIASTGATVRTNFSSVFRNVSYIDVTAVTATPRFQCSLAPYSYITFFETGSYGVINCIQRELSTNPKNIIDYLGGVTFVVCIALFFHWIVSLILESLQKHLQKRQNIKFDKFDVFPLFDAMDCYRSLINAVLRKPNIPVQRTEIDGTDDSNCDQICAPIFIVDNEVHAQQTQVREPLIQNMLILTVFDSATFDNAWSGFKMLKITSYGQLSSQFSTKPNFIKLRENAINNYLPLQKVDKILTTQELKILTDVFGEIPSLHDLMAKELSDICFTLDELDVIHGGCGRSGITEDDWHYFCIGEKITLEELVAIRMIKSFKSCDHPLEPIYCNVNHHEDTRLTVLTRIFRRVQQDAASPSLVEEDSVSLSLKRKYVLLFVLFCSLLDTRLSEMSSFRIEKTFEMLQVDTGKAYEYEE